MRYEKPLLGAVLIRRYKRFLTDVELLNGELLTVHCPNTGSMKNCLVPGKPCWLLDSDNDKRKYRYSWELASTPCGYLAGINTQRANALVVEAIGNGTISELQGYEGLLREQKYGAENSRVDIVLQGRNGDCFVEVKSVTLAEGDNRGYFPDAVSTRASKHLRELAAIVKSGRRSVLCFCVQHSGISSVSPAEHIDPNYTRFFREAIDSGVEVIAYAATISTEEIYLKDSLPVVV